MDARTLIIRPGSAEPIYRQIAQQVTRLIASGQLRAGEELPSVREVAGHHAINAMTVSRAYSQLEAEGLLERRRGKGMAVSDVRQRPQSTDRRLQQLQPHLVEIARQARELDLAPQAVLQRLQQLLAEEAAA